MVPPPNGEISREDLTQRKKDLIRLVVGFVFATKHYLRSEGGVHHADLQGESLATVSRFQRVAVGFHIQTPLTPP